jgi:streptogramin lyase
MKHQVLYTAIILCGWILAACDSSPQAPGQPAQLTPTKTRLYAEASPLPASPLPAASPALTATPLPATDTPVPTSTPTPNFPTWFTPFPPASLLDAAQVFPELTRQPLPTIEYGDGFFGNDVFTWLDLNENGQYEPDEPPMPGITIYLDKNLNNQRDDPALTPETNSLGWARVDPAYEAHGVSSYYAEIPDGYRLTTPEFQVVHLGEYGLPQFGFSRLPGAPAQTPLAQPALCEIVPTQNGYSEIAPDRSLWVVNDVDRNLDVARRDAQTRLWQTDILPVDLPLAQINHLSVGADGKLFVSMVAGAMIFDGKNWQTFSKENGLVDDYVVGIAEAPDGSYVFATRKYLSRYNPETQKWTHLPLESGFSERSVLSLSASPDGSLWLIDDFGSTMLNFIPNALGKDFSYYQLYDLLPGEGVRVHPMENLNNPKAHAFEANGYVWFTYGPRLYRLDPKTGEWKRFKPPKEIDDPMPDYDWFHEIAVGPDGSIWTAAEIWSEPLLYRLLPDRETWQAYTRANGLPDFGEAVYDLKASPDGSIWFTSGGHLLRCVFP